MSTTNATDDRAFRNMLLELSHNITKEELESIKFMCPQISRRILETVTIPVNLWDALIERDLLSPGNLVFLKTILGGNSVGGRTDLLDILTRYEVDHARVEHSSQQETSLLTGECYTTAQALAEQHTQLQYPLLQDRQTDRCHSSPGPSPNGTACPRK